jgi:hypothetical protein
VPFAAAFDSAQVVSVCCGAGCCLLAPANVEQPLNPALPTLTQIVNERFWLPGWQLLQLLNGDLLRLRRDVRTIKSFALDIITKRRQQLAADAAAAAAAGQDSSSSDEEGTSPRDLLSLFMESTGPDGKPLSTQQLIDTGIEGRSMRHELQPRSLYTPDSLSPTHTCPPSCPHTHTVINFIIAGRDTTAQVRARLACRGQQACVMSLAHVCVSCTFCTHMHSHTRTHTHSHTPAQALSWTFYLLMQHPEVEAKLLQEARDVLGPAAAAGGAVLRPSYDQLRQLRYARAVFLEALRLYPSVPEVRGGGRGSGSLLHQRAHEAWLATPAASPALPLCCCVTRIPPPPTHTERQVPRRARHAAGRHRGARWRSDNLLSLRCESPDSLLGPRRGRLQAGALAGNGQGAHALQLPHLQRRCVC